MLRKSHIRLWLPVTIMAGLVLCLTFINNLQQSVIAQTTETSGSLVVLDSSGNKKAQCPLKQTTVKAQISGFLSRVNVTQEFENPFQENIEAVYTFPLPQNAAVDDMTMIVGERTVRGKILRRQEAQAVYDAAKTKGQVASLLDQERPNIFTQSVANILPGEKVKITISYVETLKYEAGSYEFVFPMVVGPRYVPAAMAAAPDTARILPPVIPEGMRAGHDVSLDITIDAGVPIDLIGSKTHVLDVERNDPRYANVKLKNATTIPNKDFVLRYEVAGQKIQDAFLTHRSSRGGFFTLILQPPERVAPEDVTPKELVFVLDTSGSMSGFPIEKAKETMSLALNNLYPADTFNLITFSGDTRILFPEPVPATAENLRKAQAFLAGTSGGGGTEMMKAIKASLDPTDSQKHVRIVCFMTDGYVGNDMQIIDEIQKHPNARVFAFGIGSSVNRFLLDKMAEEGRGEVEYVALNDDGSAAARRFHERVRSPLLTDISINWNGLPVADVYPQRLPDLFGAKPLIITGRYTGAAKGVIRLQGKAGGSDFEREVPVELPEVENNHDVLSSLWARRRIDELMRRDYAGAQNGSMKEGLEQSITDLGLEFRLMTQFTSFVAVEEMIVTDGGVPRRVEVPVELPEGVSRLALQERQVGSMNYPSSPSAMYTHAVTVMATSETAIDTSRPGGTFKVDRLMIDPGRTASIGSKKPRKEKKSKGAGGSGGVGSGSGTPKDASNTPPVDGREAEQRWKAKLDQTLGQIVERLNTKQALTPDQTKLITNGKIQVQLWLNASSSQLIEELKRLGFEVLLEPKSAKLLIGRVPMESLQKVAQLESVRFIGLHSF